MGSHMNFMKSLASIRAIIIRVPCTSCVSTSKFLIQSFLSKMLRDYGSGAPPGIVHFVQRPVSSSEVGGNLRCAAILLNERQIVHLIGA